MPTDDQIRRWEIDPECISKYHKHYEDALKDDYDAVLQRRMEMDEWLRVNDGWIPWMKSKCGLVVKEEQDVLSMLMAQAQMD